MCKLQDHVAPDEAGQRHLGPGQKNFEDGQLGNLGSLFGRKARDALRNNLSKGTTELPCELLRRALRNNLCKAIA